MAKTTRESFKFMLRLPDNLRDALRVAAEASGRSVTAEIIERLEMTLAYEREGVRPVWLHPALWRRIEHQANVQQMDPNLLIHDAIDAAYPSPPTISDRLRALAHEVRVMGLDQSEQGRAIVKAADALDCGPPDPFRPGKEG